VGHDHVGPVQLLDHAEALAGERAVVHDELELEHPDVGARAARARRHGLHVAQAAVERDKGLLGRRDDLLGRQAADEEDRVALNLADVHPPLQRAHHRVEELVEDRPAVVDLGLGDELRVAGDVGEDERAFLQAGKSLGMVSRGPHLAGNYPPGPFRPWRTRSHVGAVVR
jgi:hypothetical protein